MNFTIQNIRFRIIYICIVDNVEVIKRSSFGWSNLTLSPAIGKSYDGINYEDGDGYVKLSSCDEYDSCRKKKKRTNIRHAQLA